MNVADSEVVAAILQTTDAELTDRWEEADIILLNTCSIRDNAEQKVGARLRELKAHLKNQKSQITNHKYTLLCGQQQSCSPPSICSFTGLSRVC